MRHLVSAFVVALALGACGSACGDASAAKQSADGLAEARRTGWQMTTVVLDKLRAGDLKRFPGIQAWLKDFDKATKGIDPKLPPGKWPALDVDALTIRNPHFWSAYYEIAPADPGLVLLQSGLLLTAGEAVRASHLLVVARQRPGVPAALQQGFDILLAHCQNAAERSNRLVQEGIELHDKANYKGALKKYQEALAVWPQNGFAHYETGLTLYHQQVVAAGEKPPGNNSVIVNAGRKPSSEVKAAFARARQHDPFQIRAYQGDDQEVIRGFLALAKKGVPAWQKVAKRGSRAADEDVLEELADACQVANNHELALALRQILVARRSSYAPADHPFITRSLRKAAPGEQTEKVLKRLAGGKLELRQLVAPEN